jgi:4'-phosphopantetheinyl transferase
VVATRSVDVWQIDLAEPTSGIQHCRRLLSRDEVERADRFYFEKHRRRFTVARAAMRQTLAGYTNNAPQELVFSYGANGKPELSAPAEKSGVRFNLAHSSELALLAVTKGQSVGADLELVNLEFASQEIAERFFAAGEVNTLRTLSHSERGEAFFSCWTRKEAYIKALGEGLSIPLDSFEVAFGPGVVPALLRVDDHPREVSRWSMYDIQTEERYQAALVVEGKDHRLRYLQWDCRDGV